ncbi:MAG: hypothetical protein NZ519_01365 [Bacteroidia bacterium]|nr:hypothetical protein [Bacteroidia bacterium]
MGRKVLKVGNYELAGVEFLINAKRIKKRIGIKLQAVAQEDIAVVTYQTFMG